MYRQGDVLIIEVNSIPEGVEVARENGQLIVAHGEATGHMHAVAEPEVKMIEVDQARYLQAMDAFTITHQEHDIVHVPAGSYKIIYQREYSPERIRRVID